MSRLPSTCAHKIPPMKLGLMCHSSWGGSSRIATSLAGQLALRDHEIHLFTLAPPKMDYTGKFYVKEHSVLPWKLLGRCPASLYTDWSEECQKAYVDQVIRGVREFGLDILNYHYAVPFAEIAKTVKEELGYDSPAIVGTLHGTDVSRVPAGETLLLADNLRYADVLTTVSQYHARLAVETFGLETPPRVLPNFIDFDMFAARKRLDSSSSTDLHRPRIVYISNFRPVKNPLEVVRIFEGISNHLDAELWLVGDGPLMDETDKELTTRRLAQYVEHFGMVQDVSAVLTESDLVLITSLTESFCLVALEAMLVGVPILATHVGGLPELIKHDETGLLYPLSSIDIAVNHAVEVLTDQTKWETIALNAYDAAMAYDGVTGVSNYEKLFAELYFDCRTQRLPDGEALRTFHANGSRGFPRF